MPAVYEKMGIHFEYPENWVLDEKDALEGESSVSVCSPDGAFWAVFLHPRSVRPRDLADAALHAMQEEYHDLDAEKATENMAGHAMVGYDVNFYCLDLTNTALIRGLRTDEATCLVMCQADDREFAVLEPVFRAITASMLA